MSTVSIVFPTYNRATYIKEAIDSVIAQTFQDWELIVIDDGSTDNTRGIVSDYAQRDPRIKYHFQQNAGEYAATNSGLTKATGDYLTIMHSDDIMPSESLELRVSILDSNPDIEAVHGDLAKADQNGHEIEYLVATNDPAPAVLNNYCVEEDARSAAKYYVHFPTFMIRRPTLNRVGVFDTSLKFGGDLDWMLRILQNCSIQYIPKKLYVYRRHEGAISQQDKRNKVPIKDITRSILLRYCKDIASSNYLT